MGVKGFIKSKNIGEYLQSKNNPKLAAEIEERSVKAVLNNVVNNEQERKGNNMGLFDNMKQEGSFSNASGIKGLNYVVLQVTLKEKFFGTGSGNLTELEDVINKQVAKGYRLHTISTANGGSKGLGGGDRIQATMVFEKII